MYEGFFGFHKRPFAAVPQTDLYYPAKAIEAARQTLFRCVQRTEGPCLVIGPAGTGKTLLCELLLEQFKDELAVVLLSSGGLTTRRGLWQAILFALGQPYRGMDEGELRLSLIDYLTLGEHCPHGMLLLVDEAHTLPSRLLEEVRTMTNLVVAGQPQVRLVLVGAPVLEERLASPKLESFSQRLAARCYLEALNRTETQAYIHAAIHRAGGTEQVFPAEACDTVAEATNGVPRLINQLCDHALLLVCAAGRHEVAAACIQEAWSDLQQLPVPWQEPAPAEQTGGAIEFGQLEDELERSGGGCEAELSEAEHDSEALCVSRKPENPLPEPIEQLEQIEQALNALEEDFQPAGSIGPEVEIVFDEPNPFTEEYEEEEVVADRCSPLGRMPARSRERSIATPSSIPPTADAKAAGEAAREQKTPSVESVFCTPVPDIQPVASGPLSPEAEVRPAAATARKERVPEWERESPTLPLHRREAEVDADDSDLIVVEDGYEEIETPHVRPVGAVRRQEYRQLFAQLRRG